jgi:hypothetical protein
MRYLKILLKLKSHKELNYSLVPETLLKELVDENLISIITLTPKRKKVVVKDEFFEVYKDIEKLEDITTRADLIKANTHTKKMKISPQDGLYINGNCTIAGVKLPLFKNSAVFLKELPKIKEDILIVGVENYENLIYFESSLKHFQKENILFVYRNKAMIEFFKTTQNKKIYFGDFDLAGLDIYLHQILPLNIDIKLYIPQNLDKLIENFGSNYLYTKQLNKYKNLKTNNSKIQDIIEMIHRYQKSLEQEYFL